jgi:hypothetical protein
VRLFASCFVGQLLSILTVVFGCRRMGILMFLNDYLVVLRFRGTYYRRDRANPGKRHDEEVDRSGGKPYRRF